MKLGAQLYTVREYIQNEKDLADTLSQIKKIGYSEVQISAVGPIPPQRIKELCDQNELSIALTHTNIERILNDTEAVIKEHEIMGCEYIGMGCLPDKYRHPEWFDHFALDFKEPAKKIAAAGKLLMYHNHHFEFEKYGQNTIFERILTDFAPDELGITLDTYWVQAAGLNPVEVIKAVGDRIPCIHLKDMAVNNGEIVMAPVLEGNMNFKELLEALKEVGVTKHLLVEQDVCLESPFTCLQKSYTNLSKLGFN